MLLAISHSSRRPVQLTEALLETYAPVLTLESAPITTPPL